MKNKKLYAILFLGIIIIVGWFIYDRFTFDCNEIYKIEKEEASKVNINCKNASDCVQAPLRGCVGSCMNKNTDSAIIKKIREIIEVGYKKNCFPVPECIEQSAKCNKCIDNVCQPDQTYSDNFE
ncbi:MAG: hypothetical protein AABZ27_07240 [Candidatus Omnitrophota bacterium]